SPFASDSCAAAFTLPRAVIGSVDGDEEPVPLLGGLGDVSAESNEIRAELVARYVVDARDRERIDLREDVVREAALDDRRRNERDRLRDGARRGGVEHAARAVR